MSIMYIEWAYSILWKGVRDMLKKRMYAAILALLLVLAACGAPAGKSGLMTQAEIEKMESLYLTGSDGVLEKLGIAGDDIDTGMKGYETLSSVGTYPLKKTRNIEGVEFTQFVNTSILSEPYGLYGVRFSASFMEPEEASKALRAVYYEVVKLYGEPGVDCFSTENAGGFSREQLYAPQSGSASWRAGELTEISMALSCAEDADNFDPSWDWRYSLDIEYRIPRVVDGKRLTGDEMLEMVKSVQQKQ